MTSLSTTSPLDLSAVELADAFGKCRLSPLDLFEELVRRIDVVEPRIRSLYAYDPEGARHAATLASERWARGEALGPLDGMPVTIKELIATKGVPVPLGSAATPLVPAERDAPAAERLREAGAVIFAKTTCPDIGMLSSGLSSFHPVTRNPWNLDCNPGGSSSGAAAAAAAGLGPLHVGTDIGGSIRLPAGWCGIVGFKPSNGRVPIDPYYLGRCAGPMTRTVADAALTMGVLALPDARDATSLAPEAVDWMDLDIDLGGLRIGLMLDAGVGLAVEDEILVAVEAAARLLERHGATIVPVPGILDRALLDGMDDFWRCRAWVDLEKLPPEARARMLPYVLAWAGKGAGISGLRALEGFNGTYEMRRRTAALFGTVDAVLSPVAPVISFSAEMASPIDDPERPFEHIAFTLPWNMGEQPAISINCAWSSSAMPIGLQIVGPRHGDRFTLALAAAYEGLRGPDRIRPAWTTLD
ncbi:Glutamyl-tRNA(Gln) amidotransferase subunit A [Hartmannibacter diazotrophicus]|uniref:Glutamyl-tRNA(Gln) amidotransferase subunit A n=1 Tax=Hartmannibacter diazotrophicus TaxID=1482074 RepID=A0A2C9DD52_9HYPH|nr:amidase [Hartmannibacter diazotrophicus]SON58227.1 Glutamyl-tRNA(Gln) amidotransferase subunit A [Hartmannibacter diazotrophicus]